jgi:hypothetical protein
VALKRTLEPLLKAAAKERQAKAGGSAPGKLPEAVETGRARDAIADVVGVSGRTLEKATEVAEAAENQPDKFGEVARKMDETGNVDQAYKELKKLLKQAIRKRP